MYITEVKDRSISYKTRKHQNITSSIQVIISPNNISTITQNIPNYPIPPLPNPPPHKTHKMKLPAIPTILLLLPLHTLTSALPAPAPAPAPATSPAPSLLPRQGGGPNTASCYAHASGIIIYFTIYTSGTAYESDYGQGLLDNLRGECGLITDWGYSYSDDHQHGVATFSTQIAIRGHCVEDAVWLSTQDSGAVEGLGCQFQQ
jgi:hypothetical protein